MTKRMTTEQLEAIRKRAEAATGEEWTDFDEHSGGNVVYEYDRLTEGNDSIIADCETAADAEFIANAREDIPALLAEVERLRVALIEIADIDDWDYGLEIAKNITFKTIGEPKGWDGIDIE